MAALSCAFVRNKRGGHGKNGRTPQQRVQVDGDHNRKRLQKHATGSSKERNHAIDPSRLRMQHCRRIFTRFRPWQPQDTTTFKTIDRVELVAPAAETLVG